ncbi:MAG: hypothetical protein KY447_05370 [Actinobacteria bacterium]|nr:hypothetical protein [Actinomycetota bacterium]MBW3642326.1 hypothetical protein [Actinomycetota bacterium]
MELPKLVQEAAYVTVGFAVLGFQRVQVCRRELDRLLGGRPQARPAQAPSPAADP